MASFLSMNGISDRIQVPSITYTKVVVDAFFHYRTSGNWNCIFDDSSNYLTYNTGGGQSSSGIVTPPVVNGSATYSLVNDTRSTIDVTLSASRTSGVSLFSNAAGTSDFTEAKVYSVKFYNGASLVAHYDMNTGTVNDQSGNGNHATLTGGTWMVQPSNYYLSTDGVDDKFVTPTVTFTKIVLDYKPNVSGSASLQYSFDCRAAGTGYLYSAAVNETFGSAITMQKNGVNTANNTDFIPVGGTERMVLTSTTAVQTTSVSFSSRNTSVEFLRAEYYDIKIYNGATLVLHYDMTTGTVEDQTGNGNHATLSGGTWLTSASSTDITVTSVIASATAAANNHAVSAQRSVSVSSVVANANPSAVVPVISTSRNAAIISVLANATATALSPVVGAVVNKNITGVVANATGSALAPLTSTGVNVNIMPTVVSATNAAVVPVISSGSNISHVAATATASANPPAIGSVTSIVGVVATANGQSLPPSVTAQKQINVASVAANSGASALASVVTIVIPNVIIQGKAALSSAMAVIPTLTLNALSFARSVGIIGATRAAVELKGEVIVSVTRPPISLAGEVRTTKPAELKGGI